MASTAEEIRLRNPSFYDDAAVAVRKETEVVGVDVKDKTVKTADGDSIAFDKLVLATGGSPRTLDCPGADLNNVYVLRTPADASGIATNARGKNVVVVGTSFIGMEVASYLASKAKSVTVVGNGAVPFERTLGPEIGQLIKGMHEKKGVKFAMNTGVEAFKASADSEKDVGEVALQNGETVAADVVVLGVGVIPNTAFLKDSGVELTDRGFVRVNERLESSVPGVYAAGDIASFPLKCMGGREAAIGHWQLALAHGRCAALNACGKAEKAAEIDTVPFFWTVQYGKSFRYAGHDYGHDDVVFDGSVEEAEFVAYYCKGEDVLAVGTLGRDPVAADFANLLKAGKKLSKADVKTDWRRRILES